ncbi:MAG: hypothetical protein BKP49_05195 [Treponema sp. CETP13]|nr:MAG: hypothetical protein BKP49_05195 [Treponema sp. CETP13]
METKEPVSVENFEDSVKTASPMPLSGLKKTKSSYDYFKELGDKVLASLKNDTSPLLPNKDGFVDLQPAYNINSNEKAEGLTQIMLLTKAAELGVPSKGFVTFETLQKAQKAGVECKLAKGSKGVVIPVVDSKNWGEIKFKNTWFSISQVENAENLIAYCKQKMTEQYQKDVDYINEKHPNSEYAAKKNPAERVMEKANEKVIPLNEKTTEPFQYIAQVLNAVQSGRKLFVTPEQAEAFKSAAVAKLSAEIKPGKPDLLAIKKICDPAERLYLKSKENLQKYYEKKKDVEQSAAKKPRTREPSYERGM